MLKRNLTTLGVCVTLGLLGCHDSSQIPSKTQELNKSPQYQLSTDCPALVQTFEACPSNRLPKNGLEHMKAVLEEQMRALPAAEANRRCQELQNFWKVACGVAGAQ